MPPVIFVHLSDIHFHYRWSGKSFDVDEQIRDDLENDLRVLVEQIGMATAILVTGDLAYQGSSAEFDIARGWLDRIAGIVGCGSANVLVIPGNHDVQQGVINENTFIRDFQKTLCADAKKLDGTFQMLLNDEIKGPLLFKPLKNYSVFAENYGCFSSAQKPHWERLYPIDDTTNVRVRGVNSAIASSKEDGSEPSRQLAVGSWQARMNRDESVINMLLCHHPPPWLVDEDSFNRITHADRRATLQLFGHEHVPQIEPETNYLRIHAGAVNPSRNESGWLPRYNLIGIETVEQDGVRNLIVKIWARAWRPDEDAFGADEDFCKDYEPYEWSRPISIATSASVEENEDDVGVRDEGDPPIIVKNQLAAEQRLVRSFVRLAQQDITEIAISLGISEEEDFGQARHELLRRYFERSRSRELGLTRLWEAVAAKAADLSGAANPFQEEEHEH